HILDWPLRVVEIARAGIHPAKADQALAAVRHFVEQVLTDLPVDHLLHVSCIAENVRQVEDVKFVDHRTERADRNARKSDCTDLRLLDSFRFAAQLHRRIHRDAESAVGGFLELLAEVLNSHHSWIAAGMNVGGFENQLLLRIGRSAPKRDRGGKDRSGEKGRDGLHFSGSPRLWYQDYYNRENRNAYPDRFVASVGVQWRQEKPFNGHHTPLGVRRSRKSGSSRPSRTSAMHFRCSRRTGPPKAAADAARAIGARVQPLGVREPDDFDEAFASMVRDPPDAILMVSDALTRLNRRRVYEFAAEHRLPTTYERANYVREGGLSAYSPDLDEIYDRATYLIDRIFKGAKPADLPFEQPTRFHLSINLKTAQALGITVPASSRYNPISFFRLSHPPRPRSCNIRAPSPSFSRPLPIRSAAASSRAWRSRAATSPVSRLWWARSVA